MDNSIKDGRLKQEIAVRAYGKFCERGGVLGRALDDWLAAEQEVLASRATSQETTAARRHPSRRKSNKA